MDQIKNQYWESDQHLMPDFMVEGLQYSVIRPRFRQPKNAFSFDGYMLDVEIKCQMRWWIRSACWTSAWLVLPHTTLQGGFCGKAMLCASTSSVCPMWETLRGPWHALWETPHLSRNRAEHSLTHHFYSLKQGSFLDPSSLVQPNDHFGLNNRHSGHSCLYDLPE